MGKGRQRIRQQVMMLKIGSRTNLFQFCNRERKSLKAAEASCAACKPIARALQLGSRILEF